MARRSKFQAPRVLTDFAGVLRALREVQESLDSISQGRAELRMNLRSFNLVAGNFQRASAPAAGMQARLPKASGENLGDAVTLHLEGMLGQLDVFAAPGDTVNGLSFASYTEDGVVVLWSNGVNSWSSVAQLPTNSPVAPVLDADYILGAANASLPNAAVATDTSLIDFAYTQGGTATWTFNTATFLALIDSTSLIVSGTTLVRAAITGAVALAQNANTSVFSGIRFNDAATTDRTNLNFRTSTTVNAILTDDAGADEIEISFTIVVDSVSNAHLANMAQSTIKGRAEGAGTGDPTDLTPTQVVAIIDAESPTWTGFHVFSGSGFTVDVVNTARLQGLAVVIQADGAGSDVAIVGGRDIDIDATRDFVVDAAEAISLTSAGTSVDRINLTALNGRIDLTAPSVQIDSSGGAGGFLALKESSASTPSVTAGNGMFWVLNDAPSVPMFTGDTNVDRRILTEGNVDQATGHIALDTGHTLIYRKSRQREFWHEECTFNASLAALTTVTTSGLEMGLQSTNWWLVATLASGTWGPVASVNNHMGILRLTTGATDNCSIRMYNGVAQTLGYDTYRGDEIYLAEAIIRIPTITSIIVEFGFRDAAGDNFIELYADTDTGSSNWKSYVEEATVATDTDTGTAMSANAWVVLSILQETLGTVDFYIDDVLEDTRSANIPDSETMGLFFSVATRTTAARTLDVDYVSFESQGMGARTT